MPSNEIMHKKSNSFFERNRKLLSRITAGLFLAFALTAIPLNANDARYDVLELLGFILLIVAALGRIWCSIYISGRKDRELCTDGPYSLCRNPLYLFSFIGVIGFFCALGNLIFCAVASLLFLLYYRGMILSEEKRLVQIFGAPFRAYLNNTPRFFPRMGIPTTLESLQVAPRVIERGMREVVWFLIAIAGIEMVELVHAQGYLILLELPF